MYHTLDFKLLMQTEIEELPQTVKDMLFKEERRNKK